MSDDWTDGITIAALAARFTPRQAARIKANVLVLRSHTDRESLEYWDPVFDNDPGHRWFCFCLDAVARTPEAAS
jgi:hypothetical protein